ncbi:metal ABC transporter permease [Desulfovibrio ferrophilus]|uniref:ABC-type transporter, integral membrane subunit n=1 Tax=Desulfovibrio ferrophilus TaxID=241368 RepID=A0A2Z6B2V2_9BACT|nr:metal ABC transporter permease [Desulfovibrio ferrophilus]BBD09822.1 ABC-type transporter, integral membrane subunit [Desulfovibrio ferrophilus]
MDFSILHYGFMQKAFLAGLLGGVSCAITGVLVVTMRITAIGTCMAHAAFAGALLGMLMGSPDGLAMAFVFSLGVAGLIGPLSDRTDFAPETVVGIVFSAMLGLAFLFIGLMPGPKSKALNLFWGSILTVGKLDLWVMGAVTIILLAALMLFFKEVRAVLCHRSVALAAGIPATAIYYAMLIATGATVTASLRSIGGLLIYSLIINPAAAAYQLSYDLKRIFILAAVFGVVSCWGGLLASYAFDIPSGAVIVMISTLLFVLCTLFSPKKKGLSRRQRLSLNFSGEVQTTSPIAPERNHVR